MSGKEPLWTRNFYLICLAQIALVLAFYAIMPVLPLFLEDRLHVFGLAMGLTVAAYTATATLARPFTGYLLDRFGRKTLYLVTYLIFGLLFFLYPPAGALLLIMVLLRLAHGLVWGAMMGAATTLAVDLIPQARRGEGLGMFGLTMNLGMAMGPAIGLLVHDQFGYDGLFVFGGLLTLLGFIMVVKLRAPVVPLSQKPFAWKSLLEKSSLPVSLVTVLICFPFGVTMNYTAKYTESEIAASSGLFFMIMALGMAISRIVAGRAFDRTGPTRPMVAAFVFLMAAIALQMLTRAAWPFYVAAFLIGMGYGIAVPVCQAMVNILVRPERRGAANATYLTAFDTGICIGIVAVGHMQKEYGWMTSHILELGCFAVAAIVFFAVCVPHYQSALIIINEESAR